jgi:hypothetical protein
MMEIKKPANKTKKGAPPPVMAASTNLTKTPSDELVGLSFKVSAEFKREFKGFANDHDLTAVDLLKEMFAYYQKHRG